MNDTFWARTDSGSANNPALNLTGDAAVLIQFVAETPTGGTGDLFLEQPTGGGNDPDTMVSIGGTLYEFTFEFSGFMPTKSSDGAQQVPDQFEGDAVYVVTVVDYPTTGDTTRLAFLPNSAATQTEMDAFGNGAIDVQNVDDTPPPGAVCFAEGTRILTVLGEVNIEDLKVGDLIWTQDRGFRPVLWIGRTQMEWPGCAPKDRPIRIAAGALGANLPVRDTVVSPQHKMLLSGEAVEAACGSHEVLAPAKGLLGLPGIRVMTGKRKVVYFHVLLDHHAVIKAEGSRTESFYPGKTALEMLGEAARREVAKVLSDRGGDLRAQFVPNPRPALTVREAREVAKALHRAARKRKTAPERDPLPAEPDLAA